MLRKEGFSGLLFILSGILMAVSTLVPYIHIMIDFGIGEVTDQRVSMMPSFTGFLILILGIATIIIFAMGLKDKALFLVAAAFIFNVYQIIKIGISKGQVESLGNAYNDIVSSLAVPGSSPVPAEIAVNFMPGFYILIVATVLMTVFGFAYATSEES